MSSGADTSALLLFFHLLLYNKKFFALWIFFVHFLLLGKNRMTVKLSKGKIHLVILHVQARKAEAPSCKGSCRGATEGLLVSFCSFLATQQETNQRSAREEFLSTPSDPRAKEAWRCQLRDQNITSFGRSDPKDCVGDATRRGYFVTP